MPCADALQTAFPRGQGTEFWVAVSLRERMPSLLLCGQAPGASPGPRTKKPCRVWLSAGQPWRGRGEKGEECGHSPGRRPWGVVTRGSDGCLAKR